MSEISIVSINIFNDHTRWNDRRELLVSQLAELDADLIALQEVNISKNKNSAQWLSDRLNQGGEEPLDPPYEVFLCPRSGSHSGEAIAILSRLPIKRQECFDFETQDRVAQLVQARIDDEKVLVVNLQFSQKADEGVSRRKQVDTLLERLDKHPMTVPVIVCGDFGCPPGTPSIQMMKKYFDSAYNQVHGEEPEYTYPTPLPLSWRDQVIDWLESVLGRHEQDPSELRTTLDYIFVDPRLQVKECEVVLNHPSPSDDELYPSDHFGLHAMISLH